LRFINKKMIKEISFKNNRSQNLSGVLHIPEGEGPFPAVVIFTGLASYKDKPHHINFRDKLAEAGIMAFAFDYTGHGKSEGQYLDFTVSQGIQNAKSAIEYLKQQKFVDEKRIGLSGTSLGALIALALAAEIPQIKALVLMSPAINLAVAQGQNLDPTKLKELQEKGWLDYHGYQLSFEFLQDAQKLDGISLLSKIKIPTLIIHGSQDQIVSVDIAKKLFAILSCQKEFIVAENEGHDFRGKVLERVNWFKKYL